MDTGEEEAAARWGDMDADCLVEIFRRLPLDDVARRRRWCAGRGAPRRATRRCGGRSTSAAAAAAARFMPWSPLGAAFAARYGVRRFTFAGYLRLCVARAGLAAELALPPLLGAPELDLVSLRCPELRRSPSGAVRRRRRAAARPRRAVAPPRAPGARAQAGVVPGDGGARRRRLPRLLQPQDGRRHPRRGRRGHGDVAAAPQAPLPRRLLPAKARAPRRHPWLPRAGVAEREALRRVRRGRRGGGEGGRHDREARGWRVEIGRQV